MLNLKHKTYNFKSIYFFLRSDGTIKHNSPIIVRIMPGIKPYDTESKAHEAVVEANPIGHVLISITYHKQIEMITKPTIRIINPAFFILSKFSSAKFFSNSKVKYLCYYLTSLEPPSSSFLLSCGNGKIMKNLTVKLNTHFNLFFSRTIENLKKVVDHL